MSHLNWARLSVLLCTLTAFTLTPIAAFALPGEATAVIKHCGQPTGENQATSQVTGLMQRDLTYTNVTLHFEPEEGGWSFTTAWAGHLPLSRSELEARMPCFRDALQEVAAAPALVIDPTTAGQGLAPGTSSSTFGISFLWVIAGLALILLFFVAIPSNRRRAKRKLTMEERPYRRPIVVGIPFLRRKRPLPKPPAPNPADL